MGRKLFVGNLSYETNDQSLRTLFEQNGATVADCVIITDRETGRSRGFGFVELSTDAEAQEAISQLDGATLDGRTIQVNEARERTPRAGGGGGGGGYGGGGGGGYGGGGGGGGRGRGGYGGGGGGGGRRDRDRDRW